MTKTGNAYPNTDDIVKALNMARQDPQGFAKIVEEHLSNFIDDRKYPDRQKRGNLQIETKEGKAAVIECIEFLKIAPASPPVTGNILLEKAAIDHANDISIHNTVTHDGSDGSKLKDRVERYARRDGLTGENIDCGNIDGISIIMALLIDDGVPDRGHRANCMNPEYTMIGAALAGHPTYETCCVIDLAKALTDWNLLERRDLTLSPTPGEGDMMKQSEDLRNVLFTIPNEEVVEQVKTWIADPSNEVTIEFQGSAGTAKITRKAPDMTETNTVTW